MGIEKRWIREFDWMIILVILGLFAFSYIGISGANPQYNQQNKQVIWYLLGFAVLFVILLFDYHFIGTYSYIFYGIGVILLIAILIKGTITNGAQSWFDFGYFKVQPSEFMKIFIILTLARYFSQKEEKEEKIESFYQLIPAFLLLGVPLGLILLQPDLGTALVFVGIFLSILIAVGIPLRHFIYMGLIIASGIAVLAYFYNFKPELFFSFIQEYQWNRLVSFINPDGANALTTGYQLKQSLIAIGSGQLTGKGLFAGTQAKYNWVPEGETDFIFTVIAEELGFIGASLLLLLFFLLIYRMVRISIEAKDSFGSYVIVGVIGMLVFQIYENIGMTIRLMPITGIPLPFISYGGSSLITNFVAVGLVLSIGMRRKKLMFS
ncbi:rod shape-determining protein RodA [Microaerobacter geothermalis]|uniref:rod shape-determining protein RodA n=1 Tax=Microaerobacter geothermalis TaxID=674972 RepID=UPI001F1C3536|nr:rod shape-determining protein RodA [Microaerobacter geothermalis]MCF6092712.1 rod shape-determining protein RodA [Microaerobacter geothermalis]